MYIIMTYDVNEKRVHKVLKTARQYLTHVQNSVLEGELSKGQFIRLKKELKKVTDKRTDSVYFYTVLQRQSLRKELMGIGKTGPKNIY